MISVGGVSIVLELDESIAVTEERSSAGRFVERSAVGGKARRVEAKSYEKIETVSKKNE